MRRPSGDAGSLAPAVPVFAFILLLLGGLVIDASRLLNARGRAVAFAEEAARAGASAVVEGQSELRLASDTAFERVEAFCDAIRADPDQSAGVIECRPVPPLRAVSDDDPRELVVVVFVRLRITASLLGIVGVETLEASGEGRARPFEGVDELDVDSSPPPVDVPVPSAPPGAPPGVEVPVFPEPPPLPPPPSDLPSVPPLPDPSASPSGEVSPPPSGGTPPPPEPSPSPQPS